jgi:hypothetical protein
MHGSVGRADMWRATVSVRIDGHGAQAFCPGGTNDADSDFAAIGDEEAIEARTVDR